MNWRQVFRLLALLLALVAGFMTVPALLSLADLAPQARNAFFVSITLTFLTAGFLFYASRGAIPQNLSTRSGFMLVTLSWLTASLFGALPFFLSGAVPTFADAFFETMSGFTTTGASILTDVEALPRPLLFWRSLTHWLGGMGIVVLTVAILPLLGMGGFRLIQAEAPGPTVDKLAPRIAETAKILWGVYVLFTGVMTVLLMLGGLDWFDSVTHAFATMATGGFSTQNASVGQYRSGYIEWVVTAFMLLAGINFALHFRLLTGKFSLFHRDLELRVYLAIFLAASGLIALDLALNHTGQADIFTQLRLAAFQAASILTTTGFASADFETWPGLSQTILFTLMFVGGCAGSTGGGIKVIRLITLFRQGLNEMKQQLHPRGIFPLKVGTSLVQKEAAYSIAGFFFLYIMLVLGVTLIAATSEADILTCVTAALSTVGNIGPGFGRIGPMENYAFFPGYVKWTFSLAMLIGRLEIYTVLVCLTPGFWRR